MNKRELMEAFINNQPTDRVPVGLWHHFVSFHDHYNGDQPKIYETIVNGQKEYIDKTDPDFVKIMSDGFFGHPRVCDKVITTVEGIREITSVGENDPWITRQIAYVKDICDYAGKDVFKYYSVFSPLQYIRLRFEEYDEDFEKFVRLLRDHPDEMRKAALNIAEDIKILIRKLFEETGIDGIFYSVQAIQDESFTAEMHKEFVEPLDLMIMEEIKKYTDNIMLHICGYGHYKNDLNMYSDYPAKIFNWAVHTEKVSLAEGKKIFKGKAVLGGFDNNPGTCLYSASEEDLQKEIYRILDEAGTVGVGVGADCTISEDIPVERIKLVKTIISNYRK